MQVSAVIRAEGCAAPSRGHVVVNVIASQGAWFAAVLGAAHAREAWGMAVVALVIAGHLVASARPRREAALVAGAAAVGLGLEWLHLSTGWVAYTGHAAGWPPTWLVGLWALFATTLNVSLRWLKGRLVLASLLGAVAGPLAFVSGARLGAATLTEPVASMALLTVMWAVALPVLMALSNRFDGVARASAQEALHARLA
ncbi:MAG: DUF2878 domain-containing protein [Burkholderiales bacterium]